MKASFSLLLFWQQQKSAPNSGVPGGSGGGGALLVHPAQTLIYFFPLHAMDAGKASKKWCSNCPFLLQMGTWFLLRGLLTMCNKTQLEKF